MMTTSKNSRKTRLSHWLHHHGESLASSLSRFRQAPMSSISVLLLIAIAFAVPIAIHIAFQAVNSVTAQWNQDKQITLFLHTDINLQQAQTLAASLQQQLAISKARAIDKQQVLSSFTEDTQYALLGESGSDNNPLPHIIELAPSEQADLEQLAGLFATHPDVDQTQFDWLWFQRLEAISQLILTIQWVMSVMLMLTVALIIINVVRWEIASRMAEIEIIKLVGASDSYVQRPFLYYGGLLGMIGALLAIGLTSLSCWLVNQSLSPLMTLFTSEFRLVGLDLSQAMILLLIGTVIGLASAAIASRVKIVAIT